MIITPNAEATGVPTKTRANAALAWCVISLAIPLLNASGVSDIWTIRTEGNGVGSYPGPLLGTGLIGLTPSGRPFEGAPILMNGSWDAPAPDAVACIVSGFTAGSLEVKIDGEQITAPAASDRPADSPVTSPIQVLDMRKASLAVSFDFRDKAAVRYVWRALRQLPNCVLIDVAVTAQKPISLSVGSAIEASPGLRDIRDFSFEPMLGAWAKTSGGSIQVAAASRFLFEDPAEAAPNVKLRRSLDAKQQPQIGFDRDVPTGTTFRFAVLVSTLTSDATAAPLNEAVRLVDLGAALGLDRLVQGHERAWELLWQGDIVVHGDPQFQRDIHVMLYNLYSSIREGSGLSLGTMGLSSLRYNGHIFWDAELWTGPPLLVLHPELARSMLEYRFNRLAAARRKAIRNGCLGAMFPWESSATGDEDTPVSVGMGNREIHVTACVGIAAWNYYCVTRDLEWLRNRGYPLIKETADFWVSRVERNAPGSFDLGPVIGADEWADGVYNDAFTNAAARENLRVAQAAADVLGVTANPEWKVVRDNIPILRFPDGIVREHSKYNGEKVKQADVELLAFPLREITDPAAIKANLEYYASRTGKGPAMSKAISAIELERLGRPEEAYAMLRDAYEPNMIGPFRAFSEYAGRQRAYFVTGAGGVLEAVMFGFCGLEITDDGVKQAKTQLPEKWTELTIKSAAATHSEWTVKGISTGAKPE